MRVWRLPDDVDTDQLTPASSLKFEIEVMARHCLETVRPGCAGKVEQGDVIVAGENFGVGSSREEAAAVLVYLGIAAVIAPSFGGLYFRNAFNVGLLLLTCPLASLIEDGEAIEFDPRAAQITRSSAYAPHDNLQCQRIPGFLLDRVEAGGLLPQLRTRLAQR